MTAPLILCLEDEPSLLDDIAVELREAGYAVMAAANASEAMDFLDRQRPDLVLCDILMPGRNGLEFMGQLRQFRPDLDDVPFIFLTALSSRENVIEGRIAGADDYLTKPIDYHLLRATIESRLASTRRLRAMPGGDTGIAALDRLAIGVVLLDANANVLHANPAAHKLSQETGISLAGGITTNGDGGRRLSALVAALVAEEDMSPVGLRLDEERTLMIAGTPLSTRSHHHEAVAMLLLSGADGQHRLDDTILGPLFGLTAMEARVACLLAEGTSRSQIADRLGISGTTVAFHLRNIFTKTGVQRQAELVSLVLSVPLARPKE